ncbi:2OG-Fe(II) oxygenase family protein [Cognatitamlana onchidii]|uniref:2OG-Fe(II) oxygenase family protein n=1 Tax=Cognatitamlana onchidii TaxID=2562860 RepID=UPI0010A5D3C1|nr:2OG-Fe(II) oxygenase family protein [Algibacter onchidii]
MFKGNIIASDLGIVETTIPKSSNMVLKKAFELFLNQPETYKQRFLQKHINTVFDGYSYMGQKDSSNQYDFDLLHSFVLSEFTKPSLFPPMFSEFLNLEWLRLTSEIKNIEKKLIAELKIPRLDGFYQEHIGHMASCNYYPRLDTRHQKSGSRLSQHVDVSLFTVFIFGAESGFSYSDENGQQKALYATDNVVVFPGYLLEYLTQGTYKALSHQVGFKDFDKDRFSFAFFSIPKPNSKWSFNGVESTSEGYYKDYLNLF